jgi:hypothetical protein
MQAAYADAKFRAVRAAAASHPSTRFREANGARGLARPTGYARGA